MSRILYALLVGIDSYSGPLKPLQGCVNDIDDVEMLLKDLSSGGDLTLDAMRLTNERATRAAVIGGFRDHLSRAKAEDIALFYYSGHGSQAHTPQEYWSLEPDRLNETLVCYDSREKGNWDLADKELSALITQVAASSPHILCVLDCCHSGTGTRDAPGDGPAVRRAPMDRRPRPPGDFVEGALGKRTGGRSAPPSPGWTALSGGDHILFAACQPDETAKEIWDGGKMHGAFTAALLRALRQSQGSITYRDLLKRAEAQVRLRTYDQIPQVEASNPLELQRLFLNGAVSAERAGYYTLRYDRDHGWVIDAGAVHGVQQPADGETTIFLVFGVDAAISEWRKPDKALAMADVENVLPHMSVVQIKTPGAALDQKMTYRAVAAAAPLPPLCVRLEGDEAALALVRKELKSGGAAGQGSAFLRETQTESEAGLRLAARDGAYAIFRAGEKQPIAKIPGQGAEEAARCLGCLEHIARWTSVAGLQNQASRLGKESIEIAVLAPERDNSGATVWKEADPRQSLCLEYKLVNGKWTQPTLRIELRNHSREDLYCALLWLGEDFSISSALFAGGSVLIPAGGSVAANDGRDLFASVPARKRRDSRTEVVDMLKLIASTEKFDASLLDQDKLDPDISPPQYKDAIKPPQNSLERLCARTIDRHISATPEAETVADWTTSQLALTVVRPLEAVEIPASRGEAELAGCVFLQGHPGLKAKARLVSPAEAARSPGRRGRPAILRDDPAVSAPFFFRAPSGGDPGLDALELSAVQNAEAVTPDNPLVLRIEQKLEPDERLLALAWDGEFFLPLGLARPADAGSEVELRRLPVSASGKGGRSLGGAVRILFQKFLSPRLGLKFDYPQLAAASFDGAGNAVYEKDSEAICNRVTRANRILLYVHGAFGSTRPMVECSQLATPGGSSPRRIADLYDLMLAFDYESVNTPIEATAQALKERLADAGLGPDHGKILHVVGHSLGGLVLRWFVEREGGDRVAQRLVALGSPNLGSPWSAAQDWITAAIAFGLNGLTSTAWPVRLFGDLAAAIETIDVSLDQIAPGSPFLLELARSPDPRTPYVLLAGNASLAPKAVKDGKAASLLQRLAPKALLEQTAPLAFLNAPNDLVTSVKGVHAVPRKWTPKPLQAEVKCDHFTFFESEAGRSALLEALDRS